MDIDLEIFFDRVNNDMLMVRAARRVMCKRLLGLISRYLKPGILIFEVKYDHKEAMRILRIHKSKDSAGKNVWTATIGPHYDVFGQFFGTQVRVEVADGAFVNKTVTC